MEHLDGNVLAGLAADLFAFETTTAQGKCLVCDDIAALGQAMVFGLPMGYVARCRNCDNVLMVIGERAGQRYLNMGGFRWVQTMDRPVWLLHLPRQSRAAHGNNQGTDNDGSA